MSPLLLVMAVHASSPSSQGHSAQEAAARLERALLGPKCATAHIQTLQTARYGIFWRDEERFHVEGRLAMGRWSFDRVQRLADRDPAVSLEEGAQPFPAPGVGLTGEHWTEATGEARRQGAAWCWSVGEEGTLCLADGGTVTLTQPRRSAEPDGGWLEDLTWTLEVDGQGLPLEENGEATVGDDEGSLRVGWRLSYRWTLCEVE